MIIWTKSMEILDVERPVSDEERQAARDRIVEALAGLEEVKRLRQAMSSDIDRREMAFQRMLADNMKQAALQVEIRALPQQVGYDIEAGQVVLANPITGDEHRMRPMTAAEHEYAGKVMRGEAE